MIAPPPATIRARKARRLGWPLPLADWPPARAVGKVVALEPLARAAYAARREAQTKVIGGK